MEELDVLVVNPSALKDIYQGLSESSLSAVETPLWTAMIANYLRIHNFNVSILDCEAMDLTVSESSIKCTSLNPKLVAIIVYGHQPSASTQNMTGASLLCDKIKEINPDQKVILIGGHVSAMAEETLKEEKCDFVCVGEGPITLEYLLKCNGNYSLVPGLGYRLDDGRVQINSRAHNIGQENLHEIMPAYDLLPMGKYRAHNWHCFNDLDSRQSYASIYTSLGCPFACEFCCINAPFGKSSFRYWNPNLIIKKFDELALKYSIKNIKITDEMFVLKEAHFLNICNLLKERQYNFNIWAYARIDTVKPHYLKALKSAGINWLCLGIESKSQFVRDEVNKGNFDYNDIKNIVKMIKEEGINVHGNFIFGLPDDSSDSMQDTLSMAIDLNCEMANFYSAMPYPGSKLYNYVKFHKPMDLPKSWIAYAQHSYECTPLSTKYVSAKEVLKFRDEAFDKYYTNENYLNLVKNKFGDKVLSHVQDMNKIKLKRKLLEING